MEPTGSVHAPRFTLLHGVIVGVILVGAYVIVYPIFRSAKVAAGRARCMSNMKQLAVAQIIYAADHNEAIPPYYTFDCATSQLALTKAISPYTKQNELFLCSESARQRANRDNNKQEIDYEHFPLILRQLGKDNLIQLDKIVSPDRTAWMHDPVLKMTVTSDGQEIETNHKEHPNSFSVMFFDSHVKCAPTRNGASGDVLSTDGVWRK